MKAPLNTRMWPLNTNTTLDTPRHTSQRMVCLIKRILFLHAICLAQNISIESELVTTLVK